MKKLSNFSSKATLTAAGAIAAAATAECSVSHRGMACWLLVTDCKTFQTTTGMSPGAYGPEPLLSLSFLNLALADKLKFNNGNTAGSCRSHQAVELPFLA